MFLSSFEDFPSDVLLAVLTLDAEHGVVVQLTIGDPILADVLGIEHLVADFALEAAQVPVFVQRYKRLFILKLLTAATAVVHGLDGCRAVGGERLSARLADTLLPIECHSVAGREWLFAGGAHEATRVVGLPQRRHHFPFNEVLAAETAGAVHALVVQGADILSLPHEEAALGQLTSTNFTDEALDVEVFVLDPQGLSFAGFATVLAGDGPMLLFGLLLLMRAVDRLLLKHSAAHGTSQTVPQSDDNAQYE